MTRRAWLVLAGLTFAALLVVTGVAMLSTAAAFIIAGVCVAGVTLLVGVERGEPVDDDHIAP